MIAVPVVLVILAVTVYLCRHKRRHPTATAFLGFLAGVLLAGTTLGASIATGAIQVITTMITTVGGLFT